jgi:hypothetical protein
MTPLVVTLWTLEEVSPVFWLPTGGGGLVKLFDFLGNRTARLNVLLLPHKRLSDRDQVGVQLLVRAPDVELRKRRVVTAEQIRRLGHVHLLIVLHQVRQLSMMAG